MIQSYHIAWLSVHPERSEAWLAERLADGFHVHHVDGNHDNDAPDNLILIEASDHMALHGMDIRKSAKSAAGRKHSVPRTQEIGRIAYEYRRRGHSWRELGGNKAIRSAAAYARKQGLLWPIPYHLLGISDS